MRILKPYENKLPGTKYPPIILSGLLLFISISFSCLTIKPDKPNCNKNVIIVVMDGARYSETWGDTLKRYIPRMAGQMADLGVYYTHFYNNGFTNTTAGHTSITTGIYQAIDNSGAEWPANPSIFQYWNYKYDQVKTDSWIVCSKDKLAVLAYCQYPSWMNSYSPSSDCGINGIGSGYRSDSLTFKMVQNILSANHPKLVLINFREPDYSAHQKDWNAYLTGISSDDEYVYQLWEFLQNDSIYKGNTDLFVTNDHGSHLNTIADGFVSHGDSCEGCRHISLFACGPDIKPDTIMENERELIDLSATIAYLLGIELYNSQGKVMFEMLKDSLNKH